jgi:hypothetical protein
MNIKYTLGALVAAGSLALLAACGGGDDGEGGGSTGEIRTQ